MHLKQSPYQLQPQQFLPSSSTFFSTLCSTSKETTMCILWYVSNENKSYSENMNGRLYCCYQKSPYQLCPHILVFMFKNYIPYTQTDRRTDRCTHTHTQYVTGFGKRDLIAHLNYYYRREE